MSFFRRPEKGGWIGRARHDSLGHGKVIDEHGDQVTLEYFVSPSRQVRVTYDRNQVTHASLSKQTRCYLFCEESQRWQMGRIGERDGQEYEVNLPDRTSFYVPEAELYVRCALLPDDPTDTLCIQGHETAIFHDARSRLVKALVKQRAATQGLTALTSSRIELFPHQVEVARRVLQDPVQRYLLADEVGLGKTIEAGIIIRQILLDDIQTKVVIAVPPLLRKQWESELNQKFDVLHRVLVVNFADLERIPENAALGLLVLDEAHHIAAGAGSDNPRDRALFEACRKVAHKANRVLLLSATPAANHEAEFLAMLHLLDPQTYSLEDIDQFRERVDKRQDIGGVLLTLTETARPYSLRLTIGRLTELFPEDEILMDSLNGLRKVLDQAPDNAADRASLIRAIRSHVSETYRLHRRMLRNRRSALDDAIQARSGHHIQVERDDSDATAEVVDALEEWRTHAASVARDEKVGSQTRLGLKSIFVAFAQAADGSPWLLKLMAANRLGVPCTIQETETLGSELPKETLISLSETPPFPGENQHLRALIDAASKQESDGQRFRAVLELLRQIRNRAGIAPPPKCVVFTSYSMTAGRLASYLSKHLRSQAVASHIAGSAGDTPEASVQRFRTSRDCFVLVSDRTGEEGRNFQFADHLIHYDLPWHPNRLEQRVGRADRISRRRDLNVYVFLGPARSDAVDAAWYEMLSAGLALLSESIASLQFYVDMRLPWILDNAFIDGAPGVYAIIPVVRGEISAEQVKVEEQAAIDEIDSHEQGAEDYFRSLDDSDAEYAALQASVEGWLCGILGFKREVDARIIGRYRYRADQRTLVPDDVIRGRFGKKLDAFGAYDRRVASCHPDTGIYRLGDEVIDAVAEYVAWDDRGQSFAVWREDPAWSADVGSEWSGFRFDLVIEAETDEAWRVLEEYEQATTSQQVLIRRGDAFLPPRTATVFMDIGLNEVTDSSLLKILRRRFSKHRTATGQDYNLTKEKVKLLDAIVSITEWERLCHSARDAALISIRRRVTFREHNSARAEAAARVIHLKGEQLRLRMARTRTAETNGTIDEAVLEKELGAALVRGIRDPRVRVDAAGFIVVSGRRPLSVPGNG